MRLWTKNENKWAVTWKFFIESVKENEMIEQTVVLSRVLCNAKFLIKIWVIAGTILEEINDSE